MITFSDILSSPTGWPEEISPDVTRAVL
jgi:hypothetical protein